MKPKRTINLAAAAAAFKPQSENENCIAGINVVAVPLTDLAKNVTTCRYTPQDFAQCWLAADDGAGGTEKRELLDALKTVVGFLNECLQACEQSKAEYEAAQGRYH